MPLFQPFNSLNLLKPGKLSHYGAPSVRHSPESRSLITIHLTKLETALEQVRKSYPKLRPTDAALIASALSLAGRHAIAHYEGEEYVWPEDYERLAAAMRSQVDMIQEGIEAVKPKKGAPEEEPITINVGLSPNLSAGEKSLDGYDKLKSVLSDALQSGVEFLYAPSDIGWQWALDRVNWSTVAGKEVSRRIKVKTGFTEGAVGIEQGAAGSKRRAAKAKVAAVVEEPVEEPAEDVSEEAGEEA